MRKIFSQAVSLATRPSILQFGKSVTGTKQRQILLTSSLVFVGQYAFKSASLNEHYEVEVDATLNNGESKEIKVGPEKDDCVLLCKVDGKYYCVSNKCSHYGAPLSQGPLFGDKVKCPWHNAAFSVKDGANEEGPMMDGIQTFPVELVGDKIKLRIDKNLLNKNRALNMATKGDDPTQVVIVGGGPAGLSAAESLRQAGFRGSITILTSEQFNPYDRTGMSKVIFRIGPQGAQFRNQEFYDKYGITVKTNSTVEGVDYPRQQLKLRGGQTIQYDKLLIATGGSANRPNVPGVNLNNVFTFRTVNDVLNIKEAAKSAKNIVVVGSSFIGLESAATLKAELKDAANITVVGQSRIAFEKSLGKEVGKTLQDFHISKGVKFHLGVKLVKLTGDGVVNGVVLSDGTTLPADLVILGTGINPNVEFVGDVGRSNGGIETDVFLRTKYHNVWAAGDVASFPYWYTGEHVRIEHHNEAIHQGFIAAMNMLGNPTAMSTVPYFWTRHFDKVVQYSGIATKFDEVIIDGDLAQFKFIAYYAYKGRVLASASSNVPQAQQIVSEALRLNVMPSAEDLRSKKVNLENIKQAVQRKAGSCKCKRAELCKTNL